MQVLLAGGERTQLGAVVSAAFAVWDDLTYETDFHSEGQKPFWECNKDEKYTRQHEVGFPTDFLDYTSFVSGGASFFATSDGHIGVAPSSVEVNDQLVLLVNSKLPVLLRKVDDDYDFHGFAWVHELFDGDSGMPPCCNEKYVLR